MDFVSTITVLIPGSELLINFVLHGIARTAAACACTVRQMDAIMGRNVAMTMPIRVLVALGGCAP